VRIVYALQDSSEVTTIPVVTMTFLFQVMGHDIQPGSLMRSTIEAIQAVHRVYVGMQDLFNKFQSLVLPEALNYLLSEEESMLEMLENVTKFSLTMYPTLSIQEALGTLAKQLRECSLKVCVDVHVCVCECVCACVCV